MPGLALLHMYTCRRYRHLANKSTNGRTPRVSIAQLTDRVSSRRKRQRRHMSISHTLVMSQDAEASPIVMRERAAKGSHNGINRAYWLGGHSYQGACSAPPASLPSSFVRTGREPLSSSPSGLSWSSRTQGPHTAHWGCARLSPSGQSSPRCTHHHHTQNKGTSVLHHLRLKLPATNKDWIWFLDK